MIDVRFEPWQAAPRPLTDGAACFAIGDVHAHLRHLEALHASIQERIEAAYDPQSVTMVWLGDYLDRGRFPGQTLDCLQAGLGIAGVREVRLRGNHEQFLLDFLQVPTQRALDLWLMNGGDQTLSGLLEEPIAEYLDSPPALAQALRDALGRQRLDLLDNLAVCHRQGSYFFAHAGIDPERALDEQSEDDLLWIRHSFLSPRAWPHDVVVVHGHTPAEPCMLPHRIGVDSGIYFSDRLTAVEIAGDRARFISARGPDADG